MTINPAILRAMQAAGASTDVIIAAIEADAAQEAERAEKKRANNAERQRRFKARKRGEVTQDNALPTLPDVTSPEVSPKDKSNPLPNPSDAEASLSVRVVEAWNEGPAKSGATAARPLDANRRKALSARMKEHSEAEVFEAIHNLGSSPFHCGQNDRGWSVNLGWLLKSPENFQKALEMKRIGADRSEPSSFAQHILDQRRNAA